MNKSIDEYLDQLKAALKDSDSATVQDAVSDAEEHLRAALTNLKQVIEQYGSPSETASAYAEVERRTIPSLMPEERKQDSSGLARWTGQLHGKMANALLVTE